MRTSKNFIGLVGTKCVDRRIKVGWGFVTEEFNQALLAKQEWWILS